MKITPDQLVQNLSDSGLMSADEASSLCSSLSTVTGPTDAETVIQELIGSGKLTAFQAQCICRGEIAGLVVDEYVVLDKIGQGGMGVVLKAYHGRLDRLAAVKKLPPEKMEATGAVERFHRESKAAARLSHPNVVTVYDAREHDGIHYLIMEYVEGQDLAQIVQQQGPLPVAAAADYVIQAARGLQYAHDKGVVHRDIKPSNLLLDQEGQIKILDMGLALIVKGEGPPGAPDSDQLTTDGQVMGTCDYMAPEQAKSTHDVDRRADIYALGCTLYRLLTGKPPYRGDSLPALLVAHQEADIPSLCDKRPDVPRAVDAVYQRMVAKNPDERYASMNEVIAALDAAVPGKPGAAALPPDPDNDRQTFLGNARNEPPPTAPFHPKGDASEPAATGTATKPPQTAPKDETVDHAPEDDTNRNVAQAATAEPAPTTTTPSRTRPKRRQRTRMMLWIATGLALSLLGIAVLATVIYVQTNYGMIVVNARDQDIEVEVTQDGNQVDVVDKRDQWRIKVRPGKYEVEIKGGHDRLTLDKDTVTVTRSGQERVTVMLKPSVLARHGPPSPWRVGPDDHSLPGIVPRPAKIPGFHAWQVETAEHRSGGAYHSAWSPDGNSVAFGRGITVRVIDPDTLATRAVLLGHQRRVDFCSWAGGEARLVTLGRYSDVRFWEPDWSLERAIPVHAISHFDLSPNGKRFVATEGGCPRQVWWSDGRPGAWLGDKPLSFVSPAVWSPDGEWIANADGDRGAVLWRPDGTQGPLLDKDGRFFAWHPDSQTVACGRNDGSLSLWKTDGTAEPSWKAHADGVTDLAWSPDGRWLVSGGSDGKIRFWSTDGSSGPELAAYDSPVDGVTWSPNSKFLACWAYDGHTSIRIWRVGDPPTETTRATVQRFVEHVTWSPDSERVSFAGDYGIAFVHVDHAPLQRTSPCTGPALSVAWNRDGQWLCSGFTDYPSYQPSAAVVWSSSGQPTASLRDYKYLRWQPDGNSLAVCEDDAVRLLDISPSAGTPRAVVKDVDSWRVYGGVWNSEGTIAASIDGRDVQLLNSDASLHKTLEGHTTDVMSVAWAPDDQWLTSLAEDGEVRLWNADGTLRTSFQVDGDEWQNGWQGALAVRPDGRQLAVALRGRGIYFYSTDGRLVRFQLLTNLQRFGWSHDGGQIAACYEQGFTRWDARGVELPRIVPEDRGQFSLAWSPTEQVLAVGSLDGMLQVWDIEAECAKWVGLRFNDGSVVTFSPAGEILHGDPAELKDKLIYIVQREPDGPQELLTYQQFHDHLKKVDFPLIGNKDEADPTIAEPTVPDSEWSDSLHQSALWSPGPEEDVPPGIIPRPAKLPGIHRWQLESTTLRGNQAQVAWSPDDRLIAVGSEEGVVRLREAKTLELVRVFLGHENMIRSLVWSPDGQWLASASRDGTVRLWQVDGTPGPVLKLPTTYVDSVTWSPDGERLVVGYNVGQGTIQLFDSDGTPGFVLKGHKSGVTCVAWSPDGKWLASGANDHTVRIWDASGKPVAMLEGHTAAVLSVTWSPESERLASAGDDGTIHIWNSDGELERKLAGHEGEVKCLAWSHDGKTIVSAGYDDSRICLWSADGDAKAVLAEDHRTVQSVSWSPDDQQLVTGNWGGDVTIWNLDGTRRASKKHMTTHVRDVAWEPDGDRFVMGGSGFDGAVRFWSGDGKPGAALRGHTRGLRAKAWAPNGKLLATAGDDKTIRLWNAAGLPVAVLNGHTEAVWDVAWSADGKQLVSTSDDGTVRLWDSEGGASSTLGGDTGARYVAWSPDGQWIVSAGPKPLRFWRPDGTVDRVLDSIINVCSVAWHPESQLFAIGLASGNISILSTRGTVLQKLDGHASAIPALGWSPDGKWLASGSSDRSLRFWTASGERGRVVKGAHVRGLDWSPDGRHVVYGGEEGTLSMWNVETERHEWTAILFDDDRALTFSCGGELLDGDPQVLAERLVYVVQRTPGGKLETLPPPQFHRLVQSLPPADEAP